MISKEKKVLIITNDIKLNQTFANRYLSFNKILNQKDFDSSILSVKFPFKPNPNHNIKERNSASPDIKIVQLTVINLNIIQRVLLFLDNKEVSFSKKKFFLALHLIFYKVDQWPIKKDNFKYLNNKASIIISGGASGLIKSASYLADKNNAKLILDYRDPINFGYHLLETNNWLNPFKRIFTINNEIKYLKKASHIITVSESLKSFFPPEFQNKISVIENGSNYDFEFVKDKINPHPELFNVVYLGTIYNDQLLDETFFKAVKEFILTNEIIDESSFKIYFIGSNLNENLQKVIVKYGLEAFTVITERLTSEELLKYLLDASMFLHLKYGARNQIITSKNADYLMFKKPILLPNTDNGDIEESIKKYNAGYACNGIEETLKALNTEYLKHLKNEKITLDNGDFSFISRREISKKLIPIIESLDN